ncbi:hypothetical protein GALL_533200 [mine drainage metagenome]|uniref:Uncharacterized protein n=1 Tax=mine drainage metagenome TaxID=410659 RepID=A0A1J5PC88_9ZZZZ
MISWKRRSTPSSWASSSAFFSALLWKLMMEALEAAASRTSFSVTVPAALWMIRTRTLSVLSLSSWPTRDSTEPWVSALMMRGSSLTWPSLRVVNRFSRVTRWRSWADWRAFSWRKVTMVRALPSSPTTWKLSPLLGTSSKPRIWTALEGPTSATRWPRSLNMARTRPMVAPATKMSPAFRVPRCTSTVATAPRPRSRRASTMDPAAGQS